MHLCLVPFSVVVGDFLMLIKEEDWEWKCFKIPSCFIIVSRQKHLLHTYICITESLCFPLEVVTTLLTGRFNPWGEKVPVCTPVFLPGKSHGQRTLVGYSSWVGLDWATEHTHTHTHTHAQSAILQCKIKSFFKKSFLLFNHFNSPLSAFYSFCLELWFPELFLQKSHRHMPLSLGE